jgi:hypothetical protein
LPRYARPLFLRFRRTLDVTATLKPKRCEMAGMGALLTPNEVSGRRYI